MLPGNWDARPMARRPTVVYTPSDLPLNELPRALLEANSQLRLAVVPRDLGNVLQRS